MSATTSAGLLERVTAGLSRVAPGRPAPSPGATATGPAPYARSWWLLVAAVVVGELAVLLDLGVPVLGVVVGLGVLVGVPTWLLVPALGWVPERQRALTSLGIVVLGVILGAALVNLVLPTVGVTEPLRAPWLVLASTAANVAMLVWQRERATGWLTQLAAVRDHARDARTHVALAVACLGLLLTVVGAVRLNNGAGPTVTLLAMACVVVAMLALIVQRGTSLRTDGATIFVVGLTLLLATSLRGWFVQGHDVQLEYVSFLLTEQDGRWSMSQFQSPYHACLSINVLPLVLSTFSGLSGAWTFKVLMVVLPALIPVQCYLWFRQLLPRPMAVLAVTLVLAFPTFTTDLPYLLRQAMAFYFLTLALLAAHPRIAPDPRSRRWSLGLVLVFLLGVMFSHYSTTYTVLLVLVLGAVLVRGERVVRRRRGQPVDRKPLVLLAWPVIGVLAASTMLWVGPVTQTGGHAGDVLRDTLASLTASRDDTASSSDLSVVPFLGGGPSPQQRLDDFSAQTQQDIAEQGATDLVLPLRDPDAVSPRAVEPERSPLTALGRAAEEVGIDVTGANGFLRTAVSVALQLALLVGAVAVVRGARLTEGYDRERVWLTVGCIGALGAFAVAPGLSVDYGVLRVFYQGLLIFAPAVVLGFITMARPLGRWRTPVVAGVVVASLATLGGLVPSLTGGDARPRPAVSNTGPYAQLYSINPQEVAGAGWLRAQGVDEDGLPVLARGRYAEARLPTAVSVRKNAPYTFPALVPNDVFTFLGSSVVQQQRSAVFYSGDTLFYRYPLRQVEAVKDVVYANPSSVVLR